MHISTATTLIGASTLPRDMPAALMASSSLFSARLPRVIIEASSTARGRAVGMMVQQPQPRNSRMTPSPRPFPTSSSM